MLISELKKAEELKKGPKKSGLNKRVVLLLLFVVSFSASYSQIENTIVVSKSESIEINYSPKKFFSNLTVAFLKLNSGYGIELKFVLSATDFQSVFNSRPNSLVVVFSSNKELFLNAPFKDSVYYQIDGQICYEIVHMIAPDEYNSFKNEQVVAIRNKPQKTKFKLNIARRSQRELLNLAKSF